MAENVVDARGMRCPWPALRLARAARAALPGDTVTLIADDPNAAREVTALAAANAWDVAVSGDRITVTIAPA